jgi:hypothetical protein
MVLLKSVVEIPARPMPHVVAEFDSDRSGIGIMAISGDPARSDAGHRLGRSKECPGGRKVTMSAQHDVHQGAITINRPIEIAPSAPHPDIRLIKVPAGADLHRNARPAGLRNSLRGRSRHKQYVSATRRGHRFLRHARIAMRIMQVARSAKFNQRAAPQMARDVTEPEDW